ncbi:hypothetical protein H6P81_001427 [Aristolochia fimbriata]|uniref:Disease resistance protein At4g27190-like leucine-rich repeats domain-containing protein n=1 Tax=Aristolochia fimbriata TaxID=158543 RepID=A0AAV7F8C2_ARIFI|nr:hypothetical protein H6P81_001427 [Aristolochia fimbriata]
MDCLFTIISEVGKCLYDPVKRHCSYLFCYARNVETLSAEVTKLSKLKIDVDNKLEEERRTSQKEPKEAWATDHQMGGCCCFNVVTWRYKLGKDAAKEILKVQELTNDLNNFHGDLTYRPPPTDVVIRRSDTIQNNESRTILVERQVKQALGDHNLKLIQGDIAESLGLKHIKEVNTEQRREKQEMAQMGIHPCCKIIITTRNERVCDLMRMDIKIAVQPWSLEHSRKLFDSKVGKDMILKNPKFEPLANEIIKECGGNPLAIVTLALALVGKDNEVIWKDALRSLRSSDPKELESIEGMGAVINSIKYSYNNLPGDQVDPMKLCFLFCSLFPEDYDIPLFDLRTCGLGEGFLRVDGSLLDARGRLEFYIETLKARNLLLDGSQWNCVRMHDVVRDVAWLIASKEHGFIGKARIGLNEWPKLLDNAEDCKRMSLMNNDIRVLPANNYLNMPELRTLPLTYNRKLEQIPDNFFAGMNKLVNLDLSKTAVSKLPPSMCTCTGMGHVPHRKVEKNLRYWYDDYMCECLFIENLSDPIKDWVLFLLQKSEDLHVQHNKDFWYFPCLNIMDNLKRLKIYDWAVMKNVANIEEVPQATNNLGRLESLRLGQLPNLERICQGPVGDRFVMNLNELNVRGYKNLRELEVRGSCSDGILHHVFGCLDGGVAAASGLNMGTSAINQLDKLMLGWLPNLSSIIYYGSPPKLPPLEMIFLYLGTLDIRDCNRLRHLFPPPHALPAGSSLQHLENLVVVSCEKLEKLIMSPDEDQDEGDQKQKVVVVLPRLKNLILEDLPELTSLYGGGDAFLELPTLEWSTVNNCSKLKQLPFGPSYGHYSFLGDQGDSR